jgi:hypothetical protein
MALVLYQIGGAQRSLIFLDMEYVPAARATTVNGAIYWLYMESDENATGPMARASNPPPQHEKLVKNAGKMTSNPFGSVFFALHAIATFLE